MNMRESHMNESHMNESRMNMRVSRMDIRDTYEYERVTYV